MLSFLYHLTPINFRISNQCKVYLCIISVNNVLIESLLSVYHLGVVSFYVNVKFLAAVLTNSSAVIPRQTADDFFPCFSCIPRVLFETLTMFRVNLDGRHCCGEQYSIYSFRSKRDRNTTPPSGGESDSDAGYDNIRGLGFFFYVANKRKTT